MGRDKAFIELNGKPMFSHVVSILTAAGCEPVIIGRGDIDDVAFADDDEPGRRGPASGLATAMRLAEGRDVVLVAIDQPLLRPETVRALLSLDGDAVVPVAAGVRQATCAVYRRSCREVLTGLLATTDSPPLQRLLDRVSTRDVGVDEWSTWGEGGESWWSLDTGADVREARRWLADP
jgi:molybdopterin-guanine dinucleotide biosynthesis protein A